MKKIYKYEQFKLMLEEDEFSNDFDEFDEDENLDSEDTDEFGGDEEFGEGGEGEEIEEEPKEETFNENPAHYVEDALKSVELRLVKLFEPPVEDNDGKTEVDHSSYHSQGLELDDVKTTDMPLNKTLILKYHDDNFSYHMLMSISIEQGKPEKDTAMVKDCGVKFKKYDIDSNLIGELSRQKVEIDSIDQDFLDTLNAELDEKYSVDNGFEIEYKEDDED